MGWLTNLGKAAGSVLRSPVGQIATSFIPGGGLISGGLKAAGALATGYSLYQGARSLTGGGSNTPALPPMPGVMGGGVPDPNAGKRSIFRDDPNVAADLKQYAIDERFLKQFFRAPKGYVILRDNAGDVYALPKLIAMQRGWWKPAKKPPISVRDWSAMKRAQVVMRKLREIEKTGRHLARLAAGPQHRRNIGTTNYIVEKGPGDVIQFQKRKAA